MKVLLQRVREASVRIEGKTVGEIGPGILVLLGVERDDSESLAEYFADKTAELRIFPDADGKMNRSVEEAKGAVLVVSQFTLASSTRKGRRPSYSHAAAPADADRLYCHFMDCLKRRGLVVASGVFQAMMDVHLINDGPVTILLDPPSGSRA